VLAPRIEVRTGDFLEGEARERVRHRLQTFVKGEIERRLGPLFAWQDLPLDGAGRGLMFQLTNTLGTIRTSQCAMPVNKLAADTRRSLGRIGVRFGQYSIYVEPLLGLDAIRLRALLWAVFGGHPMPRVPGSRNRGRAIPVMPGLPESFYSAIGRIVVGEVALRPDRLERLARAAAKRAKEGRFSGDAELAEIAGVPADKLRGVLQVLGYRAVIENNAEWFVAKPRRQRSPRRPGREVPREGNPFAKLKQLKLA